jgi:hypothetical protein
MLSYRTVKKKSGADTISLQEHLESIAGRGGDARALKLSPKRKSAIARKGGKAGGSARAKSLTKAERSAIAKKAAAARWKKKEDKQE